MARTADMFSELKPPRAKPRVMMHGDDYGYDGDITLGHMVCGKCGHVEGWLMFDNDSEAKRGVPCPECNKRSNNNYIPDSPHKSAIPAGEPGVIRRDVGLTDNTRDGGEE